MVGWATIRLHVSSPSQLTDGNNQTALAHDDVFPLVACRFSFIVRELIQFSFSCWSGTWSINGVIWTKWQMQSPTKYPDVKTYRFHGFTAGFWTITKPGLTQVLSVSNLLSTTVGIDLFRLITCTFLKSQFKKKKRFKFKENKN